jgi:RNA polymerase sigma-70 factor (ECF subfamily)
LQSALIDNSAEAFGDRVNPFRHELLVHCYRMLGSIDDAEDAVQDALVRAWNGRNTFQRAVSFRAWLYRIATNACLDAIERRKRGSARDEILGVGPSGVRSHLRAPALSCRSPGRVNVANRQGGRRARR